LLILRNTTPQPNDLATLEIDPSLGDIWGIKGTRSAAMALAKGNDPLDISLGAGNSSGEFSACPHWAGDPPWVNGMSIIASKPKGHLTMLPTLPGNILTHKERRSRLPQRRSTSDLLE